MMSVNKRKFKNGRVHFRNIGMKGLLIKSEYCAVLRPLLHKAYKYHLVDTLFFY